jgi:hypothetical protein
MTDTDVRDLLDVFERCEPAADDDIFYADVLTGLRELIPCDDITFQLMDVAEQRLRLLFVTDDGVDREESVGMTDEFLQLFWQEFWEEDGCAGPLSTGDYSTLLHHAELTRTRAYASSPLGSAFGALGVTDLQEHGQGLLQVRRTVAACDVGVRSETHLCVGTQRGIVEPLGDSDHLAQEAPGLLRLRVEPGVQAEDPTTLCGVGGVAHHLEGLVDGCR